LSAFVTREGIRLAKLALRSARRRPPRARSARRHMERLAPPEWARRRSDFVGSPNRRGPWRVNRIPARCRPVERPCRGLQSHCRVFGSWLAWCRSRHDGFMAPAPEGKKRRSHRGSRPSTGATRRASSARERQPAGQSRSLHGPAESRGRHPRPEAGPGGRVRPESPLSEQFALFGWLVDRSVLRPQRWERQDEQDEQNEQEEQEVGHERRARRHVSPRRSEAGGHKTATTPGRSFSDPRQARDQPSASGFWSRREGSVGTGRRRRSFDAGSFEGLRLAGLCGLARRA
jgi:hypothetical protein